MNVLVTGSKGFIGKNLIASLDYLEEVNIMSYDIGDSLETLEKYAKKADFVFHFAGINRPKDPLEFKTGNVDLTATLLEMLTKSNNLVPILVTSSTQATLDNPYGQSKKMAEDYIFDYGNKNNVPVYVYRLSNVFGKWSKPNYNTVVATFCYNIARGLPIQINDTSAMLDLIYIDDVVTEFIRAMQGDGTKIGNYYQVPTSYPVSLGRIAELLQEFKESRYNRLIPDLSDKFTNKLYATYLSFLPEDQFSYPLLMHEDARGSFTEFVKSPFAGQVSINVSKPGITKGDHWHHTKNEKFLVVAGKGVIRFRALDSNKIIEYPVTAEKLEVVDIPTGYTHSIVNTSDTDDLVTVMWVNEMYDPNNPDTYALEVE
ncbi:MAG: polysaccharide biosynthesis C-terminal domain-containing protein [Facklamia hominis]